MAIDVQYAKQVEEICNRFMPNAVDMLQARLKERKLVLSESLLKSVQGKLATNLQTAGADIVISFEMSGRYKDMKKMSYQGAMPPVEAMLAYVQKVGVSKFKYVPGYQNAQSLPTADVAANRIAWGLAKSYVSGKKVKNNRWFSKYFYGPIVMALVDELIEATGTSSIQILDEL
jgi:hypothetical protein